MKIPFFVALFVAPLVVLADRPTAQQEKAILGAEYAWSEATLKNDAEAIKAIELSDYLETDSRGFMSTRADDVADAEKKADHYTEFSLHETLVRVYGDTAVVTGRTVIKGTNDEGKPMDGIFAFTDTLILQDGQWRGAANQGVRLSTTAATATFPLPRDAGWVKRHEGFVKDAKQGGVALLFVGDSITDNWRKEERGLPIWNKYFAPYHAANIGISGDRTEHVLWRLENGEVDGLSPKAVVLMIGTNNTGMERDGTTPRNTPAETVAGIAAVVHELRVKMPKAKILLLAVFPRGNKPDDPQRIQVNQINPEIAKLANGKSIIYLDIGAKFLTPDGILTKEVMPDYLHPSPLGHQIWADAIDATVKRLMK